MTKFSFKLTYKDEALDELIKQANHKTLAGWAIECTNRVLPFFEKEYPHDSRPKDALIALQEWIDTGVFSMKVIRKASLDSHAAAREVGEDNSARSVARAAGQAVAIAHVRTHAIGASLYALQAIDCDPHIKNKQEAIIKERKWQYKKLQDLISE